MSTKFFGIKLKFSAIVAKYNYQSGKDPEYNSDTILLTTLIILSVILEECIAENCSCKSTSNSG